MQSHEESNIQIQVNAQTKKRKILVVDAILSKVDPPDLILLEMRMEDISGPEFLKVLEDVNPEVIKNVPIIFLTVMDKVPLTIASGFIKKSFSIDEFLNAVHHYIEKGIDFTSLKH